MVVVLVVEAAGGAREVMLFAFIMVNRQSPGCEARVAKLAAHSPAIMIMTVLLSIVSDSFELRVSKVASWNTVPGPCFATMAGKP